MAKSKPEKLPEVDDPNRGVVRTPFDDMYDHRHKLYLAMGFSEASAAALAGVLDGSFPLWPGKVARALKAGATHEQAMAVFV